MYWARWNAFSKQMVVHTLQSKIACCQLAAASSALAVGQLAPGGGSKGRPGLRSSGNASAPRRWCEEHGWARGVSVGARALAVTDTWAGTRKLHARCCMSEQRRASGWCVGRTPRVGAGLPSTRLREGEPERAKLLEQ